MPSDKPSVLTVFPQATFDALKADAETRGTTIQGILRELAATHYGLSVAPLSWGQAGRAWGNGVPPTEEPPVKKSVRKTAKK